MIDGRPFGAVYAARMRIGIAGISGYTGIELLRLALGHPHFELTWVGAERAAGKTLDSTWPSLAGTRYGSVVIENLEHTSAPDLAARCDVLFLALPHGIAARRAPEWLAAGLTLVDLGADFRLKDPAAYKAAYGLEHASPELLPGAVYGLVELNRAALVGAKLIACPGCYPTAVTLAIAPLVRAGLAPQRIVADCLSGVSGAGRNPGPRNLFCEVAESAAAYGIAGTHRHVPEIEQTLAELGRGPVDVVFTPHLVPMNRGMIATVHAFPAAGSLPSLADLRALYAEAYAGDAMVVLVDAAPGTLEVRGTNRIFIHVAVDARRGALTVVSAIDNLVKGAAGQAIQAANIALGLPENAGLPLHALVP